MPTRRRVYCDSTIYVAVFLGEGEPHYEVARAAVVTAEQGITEGFVSGLVMAETTGAPRIRAPQGPPRPEWAARRDSST